METNDRFACYLHFDSLRHRSRGIERRDLYVEGKHLMRNVFLKYEYIT